MAFEKNDSANLKKHHVFPVEVVSIFDRDGSFSDDDDDSFELLPECRDSGRNANEATSFVDNSFLKSSSTLATTRVCSALNSSKTSLNEFYHCGEIICNNESHLLHEIDNIIDRLESGEEEAHLVPDLKNILKRVKNDMSHLKNEFSAMHGEHIAIVESLGDELKHCQEGKSKTHNTKNRDLKDKYDSQDEDEEVSTCSSLTKSLTMANLVNREQIKTITTMALGVSEAVKNCQVKMEDAKREKTILLEKVEDQKRTSQKLEIEVELQSNQLLQKDKKNKALQEEVEECRNQLKKNTLLETKEQESNIETLEMEIKLQFSHLAQKEKSNKALRKQVEECKNQIKKYQDEMKKAEDENMVADVLKEYYQQQKRLNNESKKSHKRMKQKSDKLTAECERKNMELITLEKSLQICEEKENETRLNAQQLEIKIHENDIFLGNLDDALDWIIDDIRNDF